MNRVRYYVFYLKKRKLTEAFLKNFFLIFYISMTFQDYSLFEYKFSVCSHLRWIFLFPFSEHKLTVSLSTSRYLSSTSVPTLHRNHFRKDICSNISNNTFTYHKQHWRHLQITYPFLNKTFIKRTTELIACVFRKFLRSKGDRHYRN